MKSMIDQLYILPILHFSVIIHEIAHGWTALMLGDPTAKRMGRLTLNPIPHIDLFNLVEQVVLRISRKNVRHTWLDTQPEKGKFSFLLP